MVKKGLTVKCPICNRHITVLDNNDHTLYFDKKFYHTKCFLESKAVIKKCYASKKEIRYLGQYLDNVLYYNEKYYYKDCFIQMASNKKTRVWKFALEHLDEYVQEANENLNQLFIKKTKNTDIAELEQEAQNQYYRIRCESNLNEFLKQFYNLTSINGDVWRRLSSLYNGTYKGDIQISAEHLLDMWRRKGNWLIKNRQSLKNKGKVLDNKQQLLYDLAVLANIYDSYLEQLDKEKQEDTAIDLILENQKNIDILAQKNITKKKDNFDIAELLEG